MRASAPVLRNNARLRRYGPRPSGADAFQHQCVL